MINFAKYSYSTSSHYMQSSPELKEGALVFLIAVMVIVVVVAVLNIVSMWKMFKKAGKPGWASIVPVYNSWVLFEIGGLEGALSLICLVFPPFSLYGWYKVCKAFGKSTGFFVALVFFPVVCVPILGLGKDTYVGQGGQPYNGGQNDPINGGQNGPYGGGQSGPIISSN